MNKIIYDQTQEIIGLIILGLLAIGIIIGYRLFFRSVSIQNKMEKGQWPVARKPTKEEIKEVNRLLNHEGN